MPQQPATTNRSSDRHVTPLELATGEPRALGVSSVTSTDGVLARAEKFSHYLPAELSIVSTLSNPRSPL